MLVVDPRPEMSGLRNHDRKKRKGNPGPNEAERRYLWYRGWSRQHWGATP